MFQFSAIYDTSEHTWYLWDRIEDFDIGTISTSSEIPETLAFILSLASFLEQVALWSKDSSCIASSFYSTSRVTHIFLYFCDRPSNLGSAAVGNSEKFSSGTVWVYVLWLPDPHQ